MKTLVGLLLMVGGTGLAATYDTTLYNMVQNPDRYKPQAHWTPAQGSIENMQTPVHRWEWSTNKEDDVLLRKLASNMKEWKLTLLNTKYTVKTVGLKKTQLFRIKDDMIRAEITGHLVTAGPLKNTYLLTTLYGDGSGQIEVMTKTYALTAGKNSDLQEGEENRDLTYPVWAYLTAKKRFCAISAVTCK